MMKDLKIMHVSIQIQLILINTSSGNSKQIFCFTLQYNLG